MADDNAILTLRPRNENYGDYLTIMEWCREHGYSASAVFNAFIPAIAYALQNHCFIHDEDQKLYVKAEFGDVPINRTTQGVHRKRL